MDYNNLLNTMATMATLNDKRRELTKVLDIENKKIERDLYFVEIEHVRLEVSKLELAKILDEKKQSLENNIRELTQQLSELK